MCKLFTHKPNIYLIADTHFDHRNIIHMCKRPYAHVTEMNLDLIHNWNKTVNNNDTIYFLGDWKFGRQSIPYWRSQLKGHIISIKGINVNGHQHRDKENGYKYQVIDSGKRKFFLVHDPQNKGNWKDWVIHGHVHDKSPFIDGNRKTINVSVEKIGYKPISLQYIEKLNIDTIEQMDNYNSKPKRWGT